MTLQGRIRIQMSACGISTEAELARKLKIHRQTVNKWMKGDSKAITPEHLFKLSDVLKCNARWLAIGPPLSPAKPITLDEDRAEIVHLYEAFGKRKELRDSWVSSGKALLKESTDPSPTEPFRRSTAKQ